MPSPILTILAIGHILTLDRLAEHKMNGRLELLFFTQHEDDLFCPRKSLLILDL